MKFAGTLFLSELKEAKKILFIILNIINLKLPDSLCDSVGPPKLSVNGLTTYSLAMGTG